MAENPYAFPVNSANLGGPGAYSPDPGMTLRDWFAGQALGNPNICTGNASDWQLRAWFGEHRTGITSAEVTAKQAAIYADAMLTERSK